MDTDYLARKLKAQIEGAADGKWSAMTTGLTTLQKMLEVQRGGHGSAYKEERDIDLSMLPPLPDNDDFDPFNVPLPEGYVHNRTRPALGAWDEDDENEEEDS